MERAEIRLKLSSLTHVFYDSNGSKRAHALLFRSILSINDDYIDLIKTGSGAHSAGLVLSSFETECYALYLSKATFIGVSKADEETEKNFKKSSFLGPSIFTR